MKLKSRKVLYAFLQGLSGIKVKLPKDYKSFSNETYGKKSMIYVQWGSPADRKKGEAALKAEGFKLTKYDEPSTSSVQVSYFKGWHWDEGMGTSATVARLDDIREWLEGDLAEYHDPSPEDVAKHRAEVKAKRAKEAAEKAKHKAEYEKKKAGKAEPGKRKLKPGEKMVFGRIVSAGQKFKRSTAALR